jgi:hypothetical protein
MNDLISRAREFATGAHQHIDHRRKYTHQPYESHLKAVARLVAGVTTDVRLVAAAWLHDTVEDTLATHADIETAFGEEIAQLVHDLTDISRPSDGNRAKRKALDREHLAHASPDAQTVKLADLIDNTPDICRHDEGFGRIFLLEAHQLLQVLTQGDARLYTKAQQEIARYAEKFGIAGILDGLPDAPVDNNQFFKHLSEQRVSRLFNQAFVAEDIAEPLKSFDGTRQVDDVISLMDLQKIEIAGVRQGGSVVATVRRNDLHEMEGALTPYTRVISRDQIVNGDCPLSEVGTVLSRHEYCFVAILDSIGGVITRNEFEKPVVRMWLFGMITIIEMAVTQTIRNLWPDDSWTELVSKSRLQQARKLYDERQRRQQHSELLDCLQLGDKGKILISDPEQLALLDFPSQSTAKKIIKDVESLRNNLAHGQSIVVNDWAQILRFTRNLGI